ncbi:MAG: chromate resistance protein ChrB domain-containing protein [Nitrospirota bacterium]
MPSNVLAEQGSLVFSTWEGFEVDKCASIWLIKRFIDKNAVIKFFPKGEIIKEGIPFDTPDAKLRRYHNMSTFESILKHYNLQDPKLIYIGKIIHDIEVNIWEKKVFPESYKVQDEVNKIISNSKSNEGIIEKSNKYFDLFYEEIALKVEGTAKE